MHSLKKKRNNIIKSQVDCLHMLPLVSVISNSSAFPGIYGIPSAPVFALVILVIIASFLLLLLALLRSYLVHYIIFFFIYSLQLLNQ